MSIKDFRVLNHLGKGAFASVTKVERRSDGKIYALKRVNISKMSKREVQDAVNEIRVLASVRHPHIVSFLQAFLDKGDSELCIIMEFCGCGDLAQKVDRYKKRKQQVDERVIWAYLIQMGDALKHLHAKGIVHRDLKTANCFLSEDGSIKIGDLNVSKKSKGGMLKTQIGTPYYMSPEIWANRPYDAGADMWALGCTLYELAALRPPFLGDSFPELKRHIQSGRYPPMPKQYSKDLVRVIGQMIRVNPRERPTSAGLMELAEVVSRRHSDWFNKLPSHDVVGDVDMIRTIQVPRNLKQLNLPQPCYPDVRPNSPEHWPATDRTRANAIQQKNNNQQGGGGGPAAVPRPIPMGGENKRPANTNILQSARPGHKPVPPSARAPPPASQEQQPPRRPLASKQPSSRPTGGGGRAQRPTGRERSRSPVPPPGGGGRGGGRGQPTKAGGRVIPQPPTGARRAQHAYARPSGRRGY